VRDYAGARRSNYRPSPLDPQRAVEASMRGATRMSLSMHAWSTVASAFLASSVEAVEALTVVLAVGVVRGWRSALLGTLGALVLLALLVAVFGVALASIRIGILKQVVGILLLLFGMRWLRKAMLRAAGVVGRHDEEAAYENECRALGGDCAPPRATRPRWDAIALLTAFKAVTLEGVEVIIIVIGLGAVQGLLVEASVGALAACLLVAGAALILQRPLARVPENALKLVVGIVMSAFGLYWFGEGIGLQWPYDDGAIVGLLALLAGAAWLGVRFAARLHVPAAQVAAQGETR
jgi:Ca2+/H+ antiporter, TMEM165/GDT1 family